MISLGGYDYIKNLFIERLEEKEFKMYLICGKKTKSIKKRAFGKIKGIEIIKKNFEEVDVNKIVKEHFNQ